MQITVSSQNEYNGFMLSEPFLHDGPLVVLTGRNGCGKTRFLESIKNNMSSVVLDGQEITNQEVLLVDQSKLTPNFGGSYNDAQFQAKITSSLQLFDRVKNEFDCPFNPDKARSHGRMQDPVLPYESLFSLCKSIANHLNKPASELTHDEIKVHFEDYIPNIIGFQNISVIFNQYIQRKNLNEYNKYRSQVKGECISFLSENEFLKRFGGEPWKILNKIIKSMFDSKFNFTEPDVNSQSYSYNASLIQQDNGRSVGVDALSSGEKTLLWLALTLFNSQYYDPMAVKVPKLLLLDEPDAFLHPQMVVKMFRVLEEFSLSFDSRILITTHSPTTVALSPEKSTYIVSQNSITPVSKDEGVAALLYGVTQISINPENRRQVFVESQYDADVYQAIYSRLVHCSTMIDPKVSLSFVSSGPKMPKQQIIEKAKQVLGISDVALLTDFVNALNGIGSCVQVVGQVESLVECENPYVRGIIDWDAKNSPSGRVYVLAQGYAYSIENVTLDPICILLLLHIEKPECLKMADICGSVVHWTDWLKDGDLLQVSIDRFILNVLGRQNKKNSKIEYISGMTLLTDSEYLVMNGHSLEKLLMEKYPGLNAFCRKGKDGELKYTVVTKSMINLTNGDFIPRVYEQVLYEVQQ